jgi:hypothetical protein
LDEIENLIEAADLTEDQRRPLRWAVHKARELGEPVMDLDFDDHPARADEELDEL